MTGSDMDQQRHENSSSESSIRTVATASGNTSNLDAYDNTVIYGGTQHNAIQNQHNLDTGVAAMTTLHYSSMNSSSSTGVLPAPINHGAYDRLPASSTFAVSGVSTDNFERSSSYADDVRASFKRKNAETFRGNSPHSDESASSSVVPPNTRHSDGVNMMDAAPLPLPQFRANNIPSPMELGPPGSLIPSNYLGQPFQLVAPPWLDQQLNRSHSDGHTIAWNQSLPIFYMHAPNVNGSSLENANMGLQRYHDAASNINGLRFVHPPVNHQHHNNYHHPAIPMRGFRGHNIVFQPPVAAASYRIPTNPLHNAVIPAQNGFEMAHRHVVGLVPSAGLQAYHRPHRRYMNEAAIRHQNLHPMTYVPVDADVAIFNEVGLVDHHQDMRLDIDNMSYEDLLALGEQIGKVSTGLPEEKISAVMKTRSHSTCTIINLEEEEEEVTSKNDESGCSICLDKFLNREKIGFLKCGHEHHADCLKKWLLQNSTCPICKYEPGKDDGSRNQ